MRNLITFTVLYCCMVCFTSGSSLPYYYMDELCNQTLDLSSLHAIRLKLSRGVFYKDNLRCSLRITTMSFSYRFMAFFKHFDIQSSVGCTRDWLELHDGRDKSYRYLPGFAGRQCGSIMTSTVKTTSGNDLFLYFESDLSYHQTGFDMVITQYHYEPCNNYEFTCSNDRCIDESLVCNLQNPCGDYSDCDVYLAAGAIAGIVIASVIFITCVIIVPVLICRRRRIQRQPYGVINTTPAPAYGTQGYNASYNQNPNYPTGQQYPNL
ncbi:hypothetical protein ACF0H5_017607 [Mactra antiquata]